MNESTYESTYKDILICLNGNSNQPVCTRLNTSGHGLNLSKVVCKKFFINQVSIYDIHYCTLLHTTIIKYNIIIIKVRGVLHVKGTLWEIYPCAGVFWVKNRTKPIENNSKNLLTSATACKTIF